MRPAVFMLAALLLAGCASTWPTDDDRRLARYDWYACVTSAEGAARRPAC